MTSTGKVRPRRPRINAPDRDAEIERLAREQRADASARIPRRRRHERFDDRASHAPRGSVRLSGDELAEHVGWLARLALRNAGVTIPAGIMARFERDKKRRKLDRQAAILQHRVADVIERARAFTNEHEPHEGGENLAELTELLAVFDNTRLPYAAAKAVRIGRDRLRGRARSAIEPLIDATRGEPSPRTTIVQRLAKEEWSDHLIACASIVLGNWPETINADEAIDPAEVIRIETDTIKKVRKRHVPKL